MTGDLFKCDECGTVVSTHDLVDEYTFHIHEDFRFECTDRRCPEVARGFRGPPNVGIPRRETFVELATDAMTDLYGEPVSVQWLQGDHLRFLVLGRRRSFEPFSQAEFDETVRELKTMASNLQGVLNEEFPDGFILDPDSEWTMRTGNRWNNPRMAAIGKAITRVMAWYDPPPGETGVGAR